MSEYSDYGALQQPPGGYAGSAAPSAGYGSSQSASSPYGQGPYGQGTLAFADTDDKGDGGGGGSPPAQLPLPYPSKADPGLADAAKGDKLLQCFTDLTKKKAFAHLKLALIDLTDAGQGIAPYVGYKDKDLTFVGSTAKIALILPAFALRQAARSAAAILVPPPAPGDFFNQLESAWDKEFRRGFRGGKANDTKPDLRAILAARPDPHGGPLKVDFTNQQDQDLKKAGFRPRLILALDLSVNEAAAVCIDDLGFPFIHEAHRVAGVDGTDGLKLNLDFGGKTWDTSFGGGQHATARWIAELLVLIARDRLVANGLATEIHDVMSADHPDLATGIDNRLTADEMKSVTRQGKIGYLDQGPFADCAIIQRTTAKGTALSYVAVALNGKSHDEIREAGAALDDCILIAHGEPAKPVPAP
jgi:hypothetical protein